jgi:hypothetical protein
MSLIVVELIVHPTAFTPVDGALLGAGAIIHHLLVYKAACDMLLQCYRSR